MAETAGRTALALAGLQPRPELPMDKTSLFQAIALIALVLALLPRVAGLSRPVSLWMRYAAFGVLGVGLAWALVELALWTTR